MKELGSFLELELNKGREYFKDTTDLARLNTGRSAILHSLRILGINSIYLPYYLCPSVTDFLKNNGVEISYYNIDEDFVPQLNINSTSTAVLIVNYFGIFSSSTINSMASKYRNVIVDNCPAFFASPIDGCLNVYSTRKFFGVPDGAYIFGKNASKYVDTYPIDESYSTSLFLLKRIEKGSSAAYAERTENEKRLDESGVLQMSILTRRILSSIDYSKIKECRRTNFYYAHRKFNKYNFINPLNFIDEDCYPFVYPFVYDDENLVEKLKSVGIYTGRWWKRAQKMVGEDAFESYLSRFMVPIPIDQRYGKEELDYIYNQIKYAIKR